MLTFLFVLECDGAARIGINSDRPMNLRIVELIVPAINRLLTSLRVDAVDLAGNKTVLNAVAEQKATQANVEICCFIFATTK